MQTKIIMEWIIINHMNKTRESLQIDMHTFLIPHASANTTNSFDLWSWVAVHVFSFILGNLPCNQYTWSLKPWYWGMLSQESSLGLTSIVHHVQCYNSVAQAVVEALNCCAPSSKFFALTTESIQFVSNSASISSLHKHLNRGTANCCYDCTVNMCCLCFNLWLKRLYCWFDYLQLW